MSETESSAYEVGLRELCDLVWKSKRTIALCGLICGTLALIYALTATSWYRADVLLAPADSKMTQGLSSQLGNLGGLASLAGINLGSANSANTEALAVLQSRDFARSFLEEEQLLPMIYRRQKKALAHVLAFTKVDKEPDVRDAVKYFQDKILVVQADKKTGLVTLTIEWTDSDTAAQWANKLATRLNDRMRQRALAEAETNTSYLRAELQTANLVTLQQSLGRLLENELQKLMIAQGNKEFSYRVIDHAEAPRRRARPKRSLIVAAAIAIGGGASIVVLLIRAVIWQPRRTPLR
jgi:LPS O-antigen subunit length determinant protein (WzzB/FepE family)